MAVTTDAVMADTVPTVLESARYTSEYMAEMSKLVWNIRKQLHDGKNVNVPVFGTVTARSLTEGVDNVVSETMSDTLVTITPGEVGCKIILTDKLVRDNNEDMKAAAGRLLGNAMEVKRDTDLIGQFTSAGTTLGGGNTGTLGVIAAGRAILKGVAVASGGPAPGGLVIVQHPYVTLDFVDVFTPVIPAAGTTTAMGSALTDEVIRNYGVGRLFGMPYIEDGNIAAAAGTCHGGIFNTGEGSAFILATANEWSVEPERDASLRATELNIVGEYGVGVYEADWAIDLNIDGAVPA